MRATVAAMLALAQTPSSVVLPVYRDLLEPTPFNESAYYDRCGVGTGPLEILKSDTPRNVSASLVRELDAASVTQLAQQALVRAAKALPGATVTICLFPGELSRGLPYLDGVGGVSLGGGRIKLLLHPKPGGLRRVSYTVAHEYHHEVERTLGPGGWGPIDIMMREGKADHFAVSLYPELKPRHTNPLSDIELREVWPQLLEYERNQSAAATFRADFMIGKNPRVLTWPGYRLGYEMVELYFRTHQSTASKAVTVPARTIFAHYVEQGRAARLRLPRL